MKHQIPQYEFSWIAETFNLVIEQAIDGERVMREREAHDQAVRQQQDKQKVMTYALEKP